MALFEDNEKARRTARGCSIIMCVVCGILMIVGIVILALPNNRNSRVDDYNSAVSAWTESSFNVSSWNGSVYRNAAGPAAAVEMSLIETPVQISGSAEAVTAATSVLLDASLPFPTETTGLAGVTYLTNFATFNRSYPFSRIMKKPMRCTSDACSSNCDSSKTKSDMVCSRSKLDARCVRLYGVKARYDAKLYRCTESQSYCGDCLYTGYATTLCAVADANLTHSSPSDKLLSCYYPFTLDANEYSHLKPTSVAVQLRSSDDPFIALEKITQGTRSFGFTKSAQLAIGLSMLIVGFIVLIVCVVVICLTPKYKY